MPINGIRFSWKCFRMLRAQNNKMPIDTADIEPPTDGDSKASAMCIVSFTLFFIACDEMRLASGRHGSSF